MNCNYRQSGKRSNPTEAEMITNALTLASIAFGGTAGLHDVCGNLAADRPQDTNWG